MSKASGVLDGGYLWVEGWSRRSQLYRALGANACNKLGFDDGRIRPSHGCLSWALGFCSGQD